MNRSKRLPIFTLAALATVIALPVLAHPDHHESADAMHSDDMAKSGFTADIVTNLKATGEKLIALAEATPTEKFAWRPTDEVRTISEVYMHIVGTNLLLPAAIGATPPEGMEMTDSPFAMMAEWEKNITTKEDVIAKLKESLNYAAKALPTIEDLETEVALFGPPSSKRSYILILLNHAHEHLGQSIAYARTAGVVPPWSQPAADDASDGQ